MKATQMQQDRLTGCFFGKGEYSRHPTHTSITVLALLHTICGDYYDKPATGRIIM